MPPYWRRASFLVKAWKRGREIGMSADKLKQIAVTAAIFTIAPAIAIVIGVITLSKGSGRSAALVKTERCRFTVIRDNSRN